jgi:hypothetical protein
LAGKQNDNQTTGKYQNQASVKKGISRLQNQRQTRSRHSKRMETG